MKNSIILFLITFGVPTVIGTILCTVAQYKFKRKQCRHICLFCKYKINCDYYLFNDNELEDD